MSETAATLAFAVDLFSGMGRVEARRMFGGAGLYAAGVIAVAQALKAAKPVRKRR